MLYTTQKGSHFKTSHYLGLSLNHLAEQAGMTLFSIKDVHLASSQTVFNPDGNPIADVVEITMRSSTIGSNTVDLEFHYDPYDWSFPPDLIIHGLSLSPSLNDLGLDDTWNYEDSANLSKVLSKLSRMMQHGERQRVATCDNERIQVEYSCLHDREEMDCSLIPGIDGPTKVLFAVPFNVPYFSKGKKRRLKVVAKIQFLISSLVPNDVAAVQSRIEVLSSFDAPELLHSISEIEKQEPITAYIERVTKKITEHFERAERAKQMKKVFVEALSTTFRDNLLECDLANYTFASFLFSVPKDKTRPEPYSTAVATYEYPKLTLTAPMVPGAAYKSTPPPEVVPISRYSPRWPAERIIMEIWEQLWEEIPRYYTKMAHTMASSS